METLVMALLLWSMCRFLGSSDSDLNRGKLTRGE